ASRDRVRRAATQRAPVGSFDPRARCIPPRSAFSRRTQIGPEATRNEQPAEGGELSAASHVEINVPFREAGPLHLVIRVGGCRVRIVPGQAEPWIEGTYRDPSEGLPLRV